ncbi:MAG: alanine--tRNA ligase, partial [Bacteroidales bacterium]|nr:alanine--tRNA ligase [Bacteroidales bacterium]
RAVSFSIADGQLPSNAKAGYVIRRILRRAVRYGYTFLGFKEPFMCTLVAKLVEQMGHQFAELAAQQQLIENIIREEEQSFLKTLANGISRFDDYIERNANAAKHEIDGAFAFELFDTYGFPIDLTQLMATEKGWTVDMEGFQKGLTEQKDRSRAAAAVENDDWVELHAGVEQQFVGYDTLTAEVQIVRYRRVKAKDKVFYQLVFDQTPFYGEGGGQAGDRGTLAADGAVLRVVDTKKENNLIIHIVQQLPADLSATFTATVDADARRATECNHSATHLMHRALRQVLGSHVEQKGSSVDAERLRFDFSHFAKLTHEEIRAVERIVNEDIRRAMPLDEHRAMPIAEAQKLGAMALFGEKYGERVRVVRFGESVEFCGGTHVANTGYIGSFRIVSEGAVAAGMRRIEAVTGAAAEAYIDNIQDQMDAVRELLKNTKDVPGAIAKLQEENAAMRSQVEVFRREQAAAFVAGLEQRMVQSPILVQKVDADLSPLKDAVLQLRANHPDMALVLGSTFGDKPSLLVCLGQQRVDAGLNAGQIVRNAGKEMQGGGGGQPAYATAGGKLLEGLPKAMEAARQMIEG